MHTLLVSAFELDTRHVDFLFSLLGDRQVNYFNSNSDFHHQSMIYKYLSSQAILVISPLISIQILHLHCYSKRKALHFANSDLEFQLEAEKY